MTVSTLEPMAPDPAEDWTYEPPEHDPLDDEVFVADLCVEVARCNLTLRRERLDRAREVARRAMDALIAAREETMTAITVLQDALWELAEVRS